MTDTTDLNQLLPMWRARGEKREAQVPGRVGSGTEWMFYDAFDRRAIGEAEATRFYVRKCAMIAEGHPLGFNLETVPDGRVVAAGGNNRNDGDGRIPSS